MAYPFARAPTTAEVVSRLTDFGATLKSVGPVVGPRGGVTIRYLKWNRDGEVLCSEPISDEDEEPVGWDKLRRVCNQLQIEVAELGLPGLHLG